MPDSRFKSKRTAILLCILVVLLAALGVWRYQSWPATQPSLQEPPRALPVPDALTAEKSVDVPAVIPDRKLQPILYVELTNRSTAPGAQQPDSLQTELARQALLLTASESLGIAIRDEALRESGPASLPKENRLTAIVTINPQGGRPLLSIEQASDAKQKVIWRRARQESSPNGLAGLLIWLETKSRTDLVEALARAGFEGKPLPASSSTPVEAATDKMLEELVFPSQFAAAQSLHGAIRTKGKSPAVLGALARAYANLGMLAECQWNDTHKVYKARALLYAQQMCAADPKSPLGVWHRAYAAALAGRHRIALNDLETASKLRAAQAKEGGAASVPAPAWVELIDAYCKFDTIRLKAGSEKGESGRLAALLYFLAAENPSSIKFTLAAAKLALEKNPDCERVVDSLATLGGIGTLHRSTLVNIEAFGRHFCDRLKTLPGLPEAVALSAKANKPEPEIVAALRSANGASQNSPQPSWAALATWAQDARFLQICNRISFMRYSWSVSAEDFVPQVRPLVADHPHVAYVDCFAVGADRENKELVRVLAAMPLQRFDCRAAGLWRSLYKADNAQWQKEVILAGNRSDSGYFDLASRFSVSLPRDLDSRVYALHLESPYAPRGRALLITHFKQETAPKVDAWLKDCPHPDVLLAFGRHFLAVNEPQKAEPLLKQAIELSPDYAAYLALAEVYKKENKTDKWVATLEAALHEEDTGLEHAYVQVELAKHFMKLKDFKRAQPYADAAAETGSAWGMKCAADCHEGQGEWDKAEQWMERTSERYEDSRTDWFLWCKRTGKGHAKAAQVLFEAELERRAAGPRGRDLLLEGVYNSLTQQPKKAGEAFRDLALAQPKENFVPLLAAVCFDEAGAAVERDAMLKGVDEKGSFGPLAKLFQSTLTKGKNAPVDLAAIDERLGALPENSRAVGYYLAAAFLAKRSSKEVVEKYLHRTTSLEPNKDTLLSVLAFARLH